MSITKKEYEKIRSKRTQVFSIEDFKDKSDRTLVYGYDFDRNSFHFYIKDEKLYLYVYEDKVTHIDISYSNRGGRYGEFYFDEVIPPKRSYPESFDAEMLQMLIDRNIDINATTYSEERYNKVKDKNYHGMIFS